MTFPVIFPGIPEDHDYYPLKGHSAMTPQSIEPCERALTLDEVKQSSQWVVWRLEKQQDRLTKVLYQATTGRRASSTDCATWCTYAQARRTIERAHGFYQGVGLVFCPDLLPVMGVDFDHCLQQGQLAPWAKAFITLLDSYTEDSPSGEGKHVLLIGRMPAVDHQGIVTHPGRKRTFREEECTDGRHPRAAVELYSESRFFTVTEHHTEGFPRLILPRQEQLLTLYHALFGAPSFTLPSQQDLSTAGVVCLSDKVLLDKAIAARNGPEFHALWLGQCGPDASRDDYRLCCLLAFWTGKDATRIDRLFRQSGLMRDKWDSPRGAQTYGERTIERAIAACTTIYTSQDRASSSHRTKEHYA